MGHAHGHDRSTYYVEQLCILTICGLLGGVSVLLYYQKKLLMLAPNRHVVVLAGGVALLVFVVFRAIALWRTVGQSGEIHGSDHDLAHCHDHHDCLDPNHDHDHEHGLSDEHNHGHEDDHGHDNGHVHDHSWNPARYIVLLLPIVLYFLDLPNAGFSASYSGLSGINVGDDPNAADARYAKNTGLQIAKAGDSIQVVKVVPDSPAEKALIQVRDLILQVARAEDAEGKRLDKPEVVSVKSKSVEDAAAALGGKPDTTITLTIQREGTEKPLIIPITRSLDILTLDFKALDGAAYVPKLRQYYDGRLVRLAGQFAPSRDTDRMFSLVRFKITCCSADAVPLNVVITLDPQCKDNLSKLKGMQWVEVTGRVQFRKRRDRDEYATVLNVVSLGDIRPIDADPNPFIQ